MHCTRELVDDKGVKVVGSPDPERRPRQECCDELGSLACIRQFTNAQFSDMLSWIDGEAFCQDIEGHLLSYADGNEYATTFTDVGGVDWWMGLHNLGSGGEDEWMWLDPSITQTPGETPTAGVRWATDFPLKYADGGYPCAYEGPNGGLLHQNDKPCTTKQHFSCVMPVLTQN